MNYLKNTLIFSLSVLFITCGNTQAKTVEFIENVYAEPAPQNIVDLTKEAADLFEFKKDYEVAVPKKAGLQVNPWNRFLAYSINPQTQNPYIIINPEWLPKMPKEEQLFLLGRAFVTLERGMIPLSLKVIPFVYGFFSISLMILIYFALGKTRLAQQKKWVRALIAYGIITICNLTFINTAYTKFTQYLGKRYDAQIIQAVIEKTHNKEVALKALEHFDASIKKELAEGETYWKPYEHLFENYANELKNT